MAELHLIRARTSYELPDYYEEKTDVWVFGDVSGYRSFQRAITKSIQSAQIIRPEILAIGQNSMRLSILPPAPAPRARPRLKFIERIIFRRDTPEMELVIYGNQAGYHWLIDCIELAATQCVNDPSEHMHLDDYHDKRIVPRSVVLNIRGALEPWSQSGLQSYANMVFQRLPSYLPSDTAYLSRQSHPYEDPVPGQFPYVLR